MDSLGTWAISEEGQQVYGSKIAFWRCHVSYIYIEFGVYSKMSLVESGSGIPDSRPTK